MVQSLQKGRIPRNLHFAAPNPLIAWDELPVRVAAEPVAWLRNGVARIAGVSSFGVSGTNAHVIVEEAPETTDRPEVSVPRMAELAVLSAKSAEALTAVASRLAEHVKDHDEQSLGDIAYSLATTRSHHEHRLALTVSTRAELVSGLEAAARGELPAGAARGEGRVRGKTAWLFTGQGSQRIGMGRGLYEEWPAFRTALEEAWSALDPHLDRPLRDVMWAEPSEAWRLDETEWTQPALFALEVALAALWQSWGVEPDVVAGHSVGELSAAYVAGVFSLADAARLVVARGRLMQALPQGGAMASIAAPEAEVVAAAATQGEQVSIAAVNGPSSIVISGPEKDVLAIVEFFAAQGTQTHRLTVSHAFHSALMEPMLEEFRQVAASVEYRPARIAMASNVSGKMEDELSSADYWVRHVREGVRFADGIAALHAAGVTEYLEIGPRPTLLGLVPACLPETAEPVLAASLRPDRSEPAGVLAALGARYARGGRVEWRELFPQGRRPVALPTYPWQRQRYWVAAAQQQVGQTTGHPLLGVRVPVAGAAVYESVLSAAEQPWLYDHRVGVSALMPGAGIAELVRAAGEDWFDDPAVEISSLVLRSPLVLAEQDGQRIQVVVREEDGLTEALVYSRRASASADAEWILHASGELRISGVSESGRIDPEALRARCGERIDVTQVYENYTSIDLNYGPAFQGLQSFWRGSGEVFAEVALPDEVDGAERYGVHPALLDAAFQSLCGIAESQELSLPFAMERLIVHAAGASAALVHVRRREGTGEGLAVDVTLADARGEVLAEVIGLSVRPVVADAVPRGPAIANALYQLDWSACPPPRRVPPSGRWLVVAGEHDDAAGGVIERLRAAGAWCERVDVDGLSDAPLAEHVVCLWQRGNDDDDGEAALRLASAGLSVVQLLSARAPVPRLLWVTRGAVAVTEQEPADVAQASLWGLGRTVRQEHPEFDCTLIDVETGASAEMVFDELCAVDDEREIALRDGERHVARLIRATDTGVPETENYALAIKRKGALDGLALVPVSRERPGRGEVEIEVRASGMNFRDVLNALGMYPGEAGPLGSECAGVVTATGEGVTGFAVGDEVLALSARSFGLFVVTDARLVARIPQGLSFEQAATIPVAFLTAWYALHDLAKLQAGERVLVHAAAGGIGIAAVQIAQWIGAEVLGTASTAKWDVVRSLGVEVVADSRDVNFAETIRRATDGAAVDVVLDALRGEFVDAGLSLLGPGGRFIEMGKADIRDEASVSKTYPGVRYRAFDMSEAGVDRLGVMLGLIVDGFEAGRLTPLPVRRFALTEAEAAFRFMAQARHVGKLALVPPRSLRPAGTVVITGGLGALGLHVGRHLARRGVKHLVLTSRRGLDTPGAVEAIGELQSLGARVTVAAVDVTDLAAVTAVLSDIPADLPLRGVVHAAGLLDDGVLAAQSAERFAPVLSAKVDGAAHLDALTRNEDLDFFVLFSSATGTLGSAGQGGYAAANACLDALASRRRAAGLPAQSLAWGLWTDGSQATGLASGLDRAQQARLERSGLKPVDPAQGIALFDAVLGRSEPQLLLVPLDLKALRAFGNAVPPLWRELIKVAPRRAHRGGWVTDIASLPEVQRLPAVLEAVRGEIARVLSLPGGDAVEVERPLKELGLDSLMSVELRNGLGRLTGTTLPATLAFDHPTSAAIAKYLMEKVLLMPASQPPVAAVSVAGAVDEPIAIVGIGCRYPGGVSDPETFWRLLEEGRDVVREIPGERWDVDALYDADPDAAGKMTTRYGGFLSEIDRFDAGFFGIAPREAVSMDPQQRLLLETGWEALERAGIPAERLEGSSTGVFVGLSSQEYGMQAGGLERFDGYVGTGSMASVASGRISYTLGLEGPSMTVDTACSSSLVTVHLACQSLRQGECSLALAGGVALMLTPTPFVEFSRLRGLAPDGRCKSFSEDADGTGWSEGCGMLVLERLSDARRNGHTVLAVIRGSAVNQDGRSNGLTAPNGPSQEAVIRRALTQARLAPAEIGYVECHGTGTKLGDPIEVQALGAVLGEGREPEQPVIIGSVKSNIGHTQAAAGVAGLIKVVQSLQKGRIPRNLHFAAPNPLIAWDELPVRVAAEPVAWLRNGVARIAGVSSFGVSGTNAHVIVEEAPETADRPGVSVPRMAELAVLSAKSAEALTAVASRLAEHVKDHDEQSLGDIAYSLATTRSHHEHRLALTVSTRAELVSGLEAAARGELPAGAARGEGRVRGKTAWLFTGQGSQRIGMGRGLYEEWPAFRTALEEAWSALDPHLDRPLRDVMWAEPSEAWRLDETEWTQPALFALEVALAALWQSWGVEPDVVAGHSVGELSAAYVAGVFSLADAARLVVARGRLMQALPQGGAMASIAAPEAEVVAAAATQGEQVSIAAVNGPSSIVISGPEKDVLAIVEFFAAQGTQTHRLTVSHAFHSALMEPMLEEFRQVAASVEYRPARIAMASNVSGKMEDELSSADYWVRHVREGVRFADGIAALHAAGVTEYLEIGPRPTLLGLVPACLPETAEPVLAASLRPDRSEPAGVLAALGARYARGGRVEWRELFPQGRRPVALPTYPWQRQRYWVAAAQQQVGQTTGHPLLGMRMPVAGVGLGIYEAVLSAAEQPWLYDHRVGVSALMPGAGIAELVRAAGEDWFDDPAVEISSLVLRSPLVLAEQDGQRIQVVVREEDGLTEALVYSRRASASADAEWILHASGELRISGVSEPGRIDPEALRARCGERIDVTQVYENYTSIDLNYGPAFQGLQSFWRGSGEVFAEVALPDEVDGAERYGVHPALLDAAFQSLCGIAESQELSLPFAMERLIVHAAGASAALVHVRRREGTGEGLAVDVTLADARGEVLAEVIGLSVRPVVADAVPRGPAIANALYQLDWSACPPPRRVPPSGRWLVVAGEHDDAAGGCDRTPAGGRSMVRAG
ncbi:SDR family NAD(P)-dependent oxidoreductase [Komagataeibacter nataicola]|uniref:type I polyketide synthase n=2 Tax=Acetobacteraceae TaxID=433 RepID=UPI0023DD0A6C|nr:type I polyketide synthase [Komagataeibacter nataicola]WEQ54930.1 SDR family NAD(P)-dependent oxidoreductase [Komagataeibacter nataicola]